MKLLIASDIHGSAYYCRQLVRRVEVEAPEKLVLLGDILYHGPRNDLPKGYAPKEVIGMLNPLHERILAVRGNCEAEVDQMVLDFDVMETLKQVDANGLHLVFTHGHHYNKEKPFDYPSYYVLFNGHFHVQEITDMGSFLYVNCGSVSIPKEGSAHTYALLEGKTVSLCALENGDVLQKHTIV